MWRNTDRSSERERGHLRVSEKTFVQTLMCLGRVEGIRRIPETLWLRDGRRRDELGHSHLEDRAVLLDEIYESPCSRSTALGTRG